MERLFEYYNRRLQHVDSRVIRDFESMISWDARLVGIKGARGCGKTTLILQHILKEFSHDYEKALYLSLDNIWFADHSLIDIADYFVKRGGTHLFLDEVHQYPQWTAEIKNLYDEYPDLYIVFTGSSLLEINDARVDLSRRALMYELPGLSFREYLWIITDEMFPALSLDEILEHHVSAAQQINMHIKPFEFFEDYLKMGYYPYFLEGKQDYSQRLNETVIMILEQELPLLRSIETAYVQKLKQLMSIIAESAPFIPNVSRLSERIGIHRSTFLSYMNYLSQARLVRPLYTHARGLNSLKKPNKLFLDNTNLMHVLSSENPNIGNMRETFFANQVSHIARMQYSQVGDFLVDNRFTIEIGGKNKTRKQLRGSPEAFVAADDIEYGHGKTIPLWLFGFLY
jgi:predicted AAA+ superfamily ATPase